jgi:hypothetical protein
MHCHIDWHASHHSCLLHVRLTEPEKGQASASPEYPHSSGIPRGCQVTVPGPASMFQPSKLVSNPGFLIRLPVLGCVHVQLVPVGQHRPPQTLLAQSALSAHKCPSGHKHCVPLHTFPVAHALPHTPQLVVVSRAMHALLQHPCPAAQHAPAHAACPAPHVKQSLALALQNPLAHVVTVGVAH